MSFAIIETGGKQYKVSASKILDVEKIESEEGKEGIKSFFEKKKPYWAVRS